MDNSMEKDVDEETLLSKVTPWLAGVGMAAGHAAVATRCTVPQQGTCVGCCSCLVVVASLATWAIQSKKKQQQDEAPQENAAPLGDIQDMPVSRLKLPELPELYLPQPQVAHSRD